MYKTDNQSPIEIRVSPRVNTLNYSRTFLLREMVMQSQYLQKVKLTVFISKNRYVSKLKKFH